MSLKFITMVYKIPYVEKITCGLSFEEDENFDFRVDLISRERRKTVYIFHTNSFKNLKKSSKIKFPVDVNFLYQNCFVDL